MNTSGIPRRTFSGQLQRCAADLGFLRAARFESAGAYRRNVSKPTPASSAALRSEAPAPTRGPSGIRTRTYGKVTRPGTGLRDFKPLHAWATRELESPGVKTSALPNP